MGIEIERKFRVANDGWRTRVVARKRIAQAYLTQGGVASIRIRIIDDARATLTIKGSRARLARDEFEYDIPVADARQMMKLRTASSWKRCAMTSWKAPIGGRSMCSRVSMKV